MKQIDRVKDLSLTEILSRTIKFCESDIEPLFKYLEYEKPDDWDDRTEMEKAEALGEELLYLGSNDFAYMIRGFEGVEYDEIVYDVGCKLGADVDKDWFNEEAILEKLFEDILERMTEKEKMELLRSMGISKADIPKGAISTAFIQTILGQSGFWIYKTSVIVANFVSRALLGRGLALATNAMITRGIGVFLGPIGWIATGAWLLVGIAGPAFRCTVPAVVHIAMLRQLLGSRINIGVVGDGSTGKDSLIRSVFGVDTGNISPVAGSTPEMEIYQLGESGAVSLINYPGFNDIDEKVNEDLEDNLHHSDVFLMVVDISRGVSNTDVEICKKVSAYRKPVLVCLNKIDLIKNEKDKNKLIKAAKDRIKGKDYLDTAFDPDERLWKKGTINCQEVHKWVCKQVEKDEKQSDHIPHGNFKGGENT